MKKGTSLTRFGAAGMAGKEIVAVMRDIDRREWWLWSSAIFVMILLTISTASFALPFLLLGVDSFSAWFLGHAVYGLSGLVLLFNIYVVYEEARIHRIRQEFADELYALAIMDPLTGLFNRRYIERQLEIEIARSRRYGTPLTLITFDLDAFKLVNDQYGHAIGDAALKVFAERLKKATRGSDVAARCGGDEFLLLLPECKPEDVQYVLQRLNGIEVVEGMSRIRIRYSVGCTDYRVGESMAEFWKRADVLLYLHKRQGRATSAHPLELAPMIRGANQLGT